MATSGPKVDVKTPYETYRVRASDGAVFEVATLPDEQLVGFITRGLLVVTHDHHARIVDRQRWYIVGVEYLSFKNLGAALDALVDQYVDQRVLNAVTWKLRCNDGVTQIFHRLHREFMTEEMRVFEHVVSNERRTLLAEVALRTHAVRGGF